MSTKIIPLVFALNNSYASYTYVALYSALMSAYDYTFYDVFYLVPPDFDNQHKRKIEYLKTEFKNFNITYIDMGDNFANIVLQIPHISVQTYYRLLLPDILTAYDKCIYLDGDVMVRGDLGEVYDQIDDKCYIVGVKAPGYHMKSADNKYKYCELLGISSLNDYVNAGVLGINLKQWRQMSLVGQVKKLVEKSFPCQDQDIINVLSCGYTKKIEFKYNAMVSRLNDTSEKMQAVFTLNEIIEARNNPVIVHFADWFTKPWKSDKVLFANDWWHIAEQTPYKNELEQARGEIERYLYRNRLDVLLPMLKKQEKIVIFGYSDLGKYIWKKLSENGLDRLYCFCDNDLKKQGIYSKEEKVFSLEYILDNIAAPFFIIVSQKKSIEIKAQLVENDIPEDNIYIYKKIPDAYFHSLEVFDDVNIYL